MPPISRVARRRSRRFAVIATGALAFLTGCALLRRAVRTPRIAFESVTLRHVTFRDARFDVVFDVDNPNAFPIPIRRFHYTAKIGDYTLFDGMQDAATDVPARGHGALVVPLDLTYSDVSRAVHLLGDTDRWPYSVDGSVTFDVGPLAGITIPFSHRDTIPRPMAPEVSIERIGVRSIGLRNIDVDIVVSLRNRGRMPYRLDSLTGTVELNGQPFFTIDRPSGVVELPPDSTAAVTIPVRASAALLARGLQSIITEGHAHYRLAGDAGVRVGSLGNVPLRLDETGDVRLAR